MYIYYNPIYTTLKNLFLVSEVNVMTTGKNKLNSLVNVVSYDLAVKAIEGILMLITKSHNPFWVLRQVFSDAQSDVNWCSAVSV